MENISEWKNKIHCGNSLDFDFIKSIIPPNSIDCIITDPPYGMTKFKWDNEIVDLENFWKIINYCIKDDGNIIIFAKQPFTSKLIMSNLEMYRYTVVWKKNRISDFLNSNKKILNIHEDIVIFYKKFRVYNPQFILNAGKPYIRKNKSKVVKDQETTYNTYNVKEEYLNDGKRFPSSVLEFKRVEKKSHPAEKPIELLKFLVKSFSEYESCIFDPFCGSGSTLKAAINCGNCFIGIDNCPEFCELSKTNIAV